MSSLFYKYTLSNFEQSELMRLKGISNSAALYIDGDVHDSLMSMYKHKDDIVSITQNPLYNRIHNMLHDQVDANMLKSPIYTLVKSENGQQYEFGVTSYEKPYFRHAYKSFPVSLISMYLTGGILSPYSDEYGSWLSAFSTIKNKKGDIVALLMVDEKYAPFKEKIKRQTVEALLIAVGLFTLMYILLVIILSQQLYKENLDKEMITESNKQNSLMKEQLFSVNKNLVDNDAVRKEMITNISHDLRTPLSNIMGYLDLLKSKTNLSKDTSEDYLNVAHSESVKLKVMIADLFELSKLESGAIILQKEPFIIAELIFDILAAFNHQIAANNIDIKTDIKSEGMVYGDIKYVERLFRNLMENALKYVYEGGFIKISVTDIGKTVQIKVCNEGDPIDKETQEHIFDRLFTKGPKSGSGLGLAISKKICNLHDSDLILNVDGNINSFHFALNKFNP
jgi:signal transduction histidine kinase